MTEPYDGKDTDWRCPRCGSPRWVTIADYPGGPRVRLCVPCGRVTSDGAAPMRRSEDSDQKDAVVGDEPVRTTSITAAFAAIDKAMAPGAYYATTSRHLVEAAVDAVLAVAEPLHRRTALNEAIAAVEALQFPHNQLLSCETSGELAMSRGSGHGMDDPFCPVHKDGKCLQEYAQVRDVVERLRGLRDTETPA